MNNTGMDTLQTERLKHLPNVNSLLIISLGLIFFTILSTAFVYAETVSVDIAGTPYDVDYTATGMTVSGVEADMDFISLIFTVDVTSSPGTLDITFERSFFDSVYQGADDDFIILADGDEPNFTETDTTTQSRTLSIDLPAGTEEVEIIGSIFESSAPPVVEEPVEEPPVEEPPVEEPPVEEPPVEESPVETPEEEKPMTQCGPGTILQDGECVLDERCGPGTTLVDGVCVLDAAEQPSGDGIQLSKGMNRELVMGVIAAFVVAGAVGIILGLMSKASKSRD